MRLISYIDSFEHDHAFCSHFSNKGAIKSYLGHSHPSAWLVVHPTIDFEVNLLKSTLDNIKVYN